MGVLVSAPVRIDISAGWPDSDPYRKTYGGIVLNGAINHRVLAIFTKDLSISLGEVPSQSGLGTSGALRAVELVASNSDLIKDKHDLIKRVHAFENQIIGYRAGFQDEAAAVYGGVNLWFFYKNGSIDCKKVPIEQAEHLEKRLVLVYTGERRLSRNIHDLVFGSKNYRKKIPIITRMKGIAKEMAKNITDEKRMGILIDETWKLQKALHSSIETPRMRALEDKLKGLYIGARAIGAGGGGSMLFYTTDKNKLTKALESLLESPTYQGTRIIPFRFDYEGIRLEKIKDV